MKSTGIVRKVDGLDRVVLPKELCRTMEIEPKDSLEIYIEDLKIVLKKHNPADISAKTRGNLGIVRHVDSADRIVIPKEICKTMGISQDTSLEIFVDNHKILLSIYESGCIFCKEASDTVTYQGKVICKKCIKELQKLI